MKLVVGYPLRSYSHGGSKDIITAPTVGARPRTTFSATAEDQRCVRCEQVGQYQRPVPSRAACSSTRVLRSMPGS